ncbi:MAG: hypothetical protein P4L81_07525, partial [Candidatus Pacebacteria bacterium]|nr:hypothetical protein [Candidatus Paceibacterota bacterium]
MTAKFWVRDDDAIETSQSLERLRDFADNYGIRIGLAVIPGKIRPNLTDFLDLSPKQFYPMCHGWNHIDHGRVNKPGEFGPDRPLSNMINDARSALSLFSERFDTVKAIFVPPFNRVTPAVVRALPNIGFFGVSLMPSYLERKVLQFGPPLAWTNLIKIPEFSGSPRIDVHLDMIDWKTNTARETDRIVDHLVRHLRGRRLGLLPASTPIGLLTHHLVHNDEIWRSCNEALEVLRSDNAVEFIDVGRWADDYSL